MNLILRLIVYLIVLALAWAIVSYIPLPPAFSWIVPVVFLLIILIIVLAEFGVIRGGPPLNP
jgi:small-conductance mechanosensitive channel